MTSRRAPAWRHKGEASGQTGYKGGGANRRPLLMDERWPADGAAARLHGFPSIGRRTKRSGMARYPGKFATPQPAKRFTKS